MKYKKGSTHPPNLDIHRSRNKFLSDSKCPTRLPNLDIHRSRNKFLSDSKGSHTSFVIAFVIFISFIIFMVIILRPSGNFESNEKFLLNYLEGRIIEDTSEELIIISALEEKKAKCDEINSLNIKNYISKQSGNLLKIYSSDEFEQNTFSCAPPQGYTLGLIRVENYVFEEKIKEIQIKYNKDYERLKKEFNIPETNDFAFNFLDSDNNLILEAPTKEIPSADVFAKSIQIIYVDNQANIKAGHLNIKVW